MTDATIRQEERPALTAGHVPVRLAGGDLTANYYIIECEHGTTELHEMEGVDPAEVEANLITKHHATLGCTCQPS